MPNTEVRARSRKEGTRLCRIRFSLRAHRYVVCGSYEHVTDWHHWVAPVMHHAWFQCTKSTECTYRKIQKFLRLLLYLSYFYGYYPTTTTLYADTLVCIIMIYRCKCEHWFLNTIRLYCGLVRPKWFVHKTGHTEFPSKAETRKILDTGMHIFSCR